MSADNLKIGEGADATARALAELEQVIARLVSPNGCEWDRAQTPDTLCDYLAEETFELIDAIRRQDAAGVTEELGDVFFLLLWLARLHNETHGLTLARALAGSAAKMIRRHPHVFGDVKVADVEELYRNWERIKAEEKAQAAQTAGNAGENDAPAGVFASLPRGLPPLLKAYRIHSRAARVGFTWEDDEDVEQQVEAEWLEWIDARLREDDNACFHELGDMIFSLVELGRRKGIKANAALDATNRRFLDRFARMESLAGARGLDFAALSLDEKNALWDEVKSEEK